MSKSIRFEDYKDKILAELNTRGQKLGINEPVTLVESFVNQPINSELGGNFVIGGPSIPMIMLVGNSGRVYFFALKALVSDLEL